MHSTLNDFEKEKKELLLQIENLKKKLLAYKRAYDNQSLLSILFYKFFNIKIDAFFKGARKFNYKIKSENLTKRRSILSDKILCTIVNHNHNDNALSLYNLHLNYFDSVIMDSGSNNPPKNAVKFNNIYYAALLNNAYLLATKNNYKYLLFICSDVLVSADELYKMYTRLLTLNYNKIGVYSPSSKGFSHSFCKKETECELREVPFVEGFMFLCDVKILGDFCPIDTKENLYGWGLDIAKSFFAKKRNKICVIDDAVEVEHLSGTGYSREIAEYEMLSWLKTLNNEEIICFFEDQINELKNSSI